MSGHDRARIRMDDGEIRAFLDEARTMTLSTFSPDGSIHSVAMWYGFIGANLAFGTKVKSQKAQNLLRNPTLTCLIESGSLDYDLLKGVEIVGVGRIVTDPAERWEQGRSSYERNVGPYAEAVRETIERNLQKRLIVCVEPRKFVSWDHSKLPPRGSTPASGQHERDELPLGPLPASPSSAPLKPHSR